MSMEPNTPPKPKGRHRAAPPASDPSNVVALESFFPTEQLPIIEPRKPLTRRERREREAAERRMQHRKALTMATGSMLVVSAAGGAYSMQQATSSMRTGSSSEAVAAPPLLQDPITADTVQVVFEAPKVNTEAAPPPPPPPPPPAPVRVEQAAPAPAPAPAPVAKAVAAPPPAPAPATGKAAAIAQAALNQVGAVQDCTMLVTNSLRSVGITFHDWPIGYLSLGRQVSMAEAVPGDLLYYVNGAGTSVAGLAHIAVYIGNGKAVHGGFNGNQTVIWSVNVGYGAGTPPTAIVRVA
jgi:cell wall-associated NlpC family hydrolase